MVHDVDISLYPDWVGGTQTRAVSLVGAELTLSTPPIEIEGSMVETIIVWRRSVDQREEA